MHKSHPAILKKEIIQSFNRAATTYDEAAFFQREISDRLLERLVYIPLSPTFILDLGAGTGYATLQLERRYKRSKVIAFDFAEKMLMKAKENRRWFDRKRYICGDIERLPFAEESFGLVFSNLVLHWIDNIRGTLQEVNRVLKPNGLFLFSTLGTDTLYELRQSWAVADAEKQHVHQFIDMQGIGDSLYRAHFLDPVVDMEFVTITYNDLKKIFLDLKHLGAHNIVKDRQKGLTGKATFEKFVHAYEQHRNAEGLIPLTYEVIYGLGWKREGGRKETEISIPISSIT
jgi:malonyl-CoA O-methyltransferase